MHVAVQVHTAWPHVPKHGVTQLLPTNTCLALQSNIYAQQLRRKPLHLTCSKEKSKHVGLVWVYISGKHACSMLAHM